MFFLKRVHMQFPYLSGKPRNVQTGLPAAGDVPGGDDLRTLLFDIVCDGGQVAHLAAGTDFRLAVKVKGHARQDHS